MKRVGVRLLAEFRSTGRNRPMLVTYRFSGFRELLRRGVVVLFEADLSRIQGVPDFIRVETSNAEAAQTSA